MSIANQYNPAQAAEALKGTFRSRGARSTKPVKAKTGAFPVPAVISGRLKIERAGAEASKHIAKALVTTIEAIFDIGAQLAIIRAEVESTDCGFEGKTPDQRYGAALKEVVQTRNRDCDLSSETLRKYRIIATEYGDRKQEIIDGKISIRSLFEATRASDPNESLDTLLRGEALPKPATKLSKSFKAKAEDLRSSSAAEYAEKGMLFIATYDDSDLTEHSYVICGSREMAETRICAKLMNTEWFKKIHHQDEELMERTLREIVKATRKSGKWVFGDLNDKIRWNPDVGSKDVSISIIETKVDGAKWLEL